MHEKHLINGSFFFSSDSFPGDSELTDYVDGLARDPDKFVNPHNADTGETILHLLAKEGKVRSKDIFLPAERRSKNGESCSCSGGVVGGGGAVCQSKN